MQSLIGNRWTGSETTGCRRRADLTQLPPQAGLV